MQRVTKTIYVLNGPNLNLLGTREPDIYGHATIEDVEQLCRETADRHGLGLVFRQSNYEGEIVDWIQEAYGQQAAGLVINPAAYTHTSVAIFDALSVLKVPIIELHISNIHARESFRRRSFVSPVARAIVCGFGVNGYSLAISGLAAMIETKA
jgi:3-dehydroquinate dehydratase-2